MSPESGSFDHGQTNVGPGFEMFQILLLFEQLRPLAGRTG
jgi:hypothetical protein